MVSCAEWDGAKWKTSHDYKITKWQTTEMKNIYGTVNREYKLSKRKKLLRECKNCGHKQFNARSHHRRAKWVNSTTC